MNTDEKIKKMLKGFSFPSRKGLTKDVVDYLKRDYFNSTCEICGENRIRALEIHHIQLVKYGGKDALNNIACLCTTCHRLTHSYGIELKRKIPNIERREFFEKVIKPTIILSETAESDKQVIDFLNEKWEEIKK